MLFLIAEIYWFYADSEGKGAFSKSFVTEKRLYFILTNLKTYKTILRKIWPFLQRDE